MRLRSLEAMTGARALSPAAAGLSDKGCVRRLSRECVAGWCGQWGVGPDARAGGGLEGPMSVVRAG